MLEEKLSPATLRLVETAKQIAAEVVAPNAQGWDRENRFPHELFSALHRAKLDAMCVPSALGGLGIGPDTDDPLPVWLVTRALASADSASCHGQQVHTNMTHTVALLGTPEQKERFLRPVVDAGAIFGGWGSEQNGQPPAGPRPASTVAHRVGGGWELTGRKFYSTNAGAAKFAIVFAFPDNVANPTSQLLLCMVDCESPGVSVQPRWWDQATGMRATVSHEVDFDRVFVADDAVIGPPGSYWSSQVQARYLPQFSSNFQGVGAHLFEYAVNYLRERRRTSDPFIQHHMAEAKVMLVTAELLLAETAELYRARRYPQAFDYSRMLRAYSQTAVQRVVELVQACCGSSIYMEPGPVSRMMRDWQFYCHHENLDLILTATGKTIFGLGGEGSPEAFGFGRSGDRPADSVHGAAGREK
ncbi:MAG TPA: acyl-CoA dehydrogenase family protein [Candidatus Binataceae bacterium]|nr:acyl-CoA dehydrogenase family protein [Candidatus Binataceae bacterium]